MSFQNQLTNFLVAAMTSKRAMEYSHKWKTWQIAPDWKIPAIRASRAKVSTDCFGWPSPQTHDAQGGKTQEQVEAMRARTRAGVSNLNEVFQMAGWPSPKTPTGGASPNSPKRDNGGQFHKLEDVALLTGWNTPRATDGTNGWPNQAGGALLGWAQTGAGKADKLSYQAVREVGAIPSSSPAETEKPAAYQLNASFSRWLMGYSAAWDAASPNYGDWLRVQEEIASGG